MRKRILLLALTLILAMCLCACHIVNFGNNPPSTNTGATDTGSTETDTESDVNTDIGTDTETDTDTDTDTETNTDTDADTDTDTDIDTPTEPDEPDEPDEPEIPVDPETCTHQSIGKIDKVEPTCSTVGYTEARACNICKKIIAGGKEIPTIPHNSAPMKDTEPTCSKEGTIGGEACVDCGAIVVEPDLIPTIPHTEVTVAGREPTCNQVGLTNGKQCRVCGTMTVPQKELAKYPHNEVTIKGYEATCNSAGLSDGKKCTVCKEITVEQVEVPKASHTMIVEPAVLPTCKSVGYTEGRVCSSCNEVVLQKTEIPKTGHTEVIDKEVPATCQSAGLTEGSHCGVCGTVIKAQTIISSSSSAHDYGYQFSSVSKTPTLSASGSATLKCQVCGQTKTVSLPKLSSGVLSKDDIYSVTTDEFNPAIDNIWNVFDGKTASGGLYGAGDDWFGNVGDKLVITLKQEIVLTYLHLYTTGNYTYATVTVKDASGNVTKTKTLRADGDNVRQAVVSNEQIKAYTIEIEIKELKWSSAYTFKVSEVQIQGAKPDVRLEHTHVYREFVETTKEATCLVAGKAYYACYCGLTKEQETPKKSQHEYNTLSAVTYASCTANGKEIYTCDCGAKKEVTLEAKGHIYYELVSYLKEPTVTSAGQAKFRCIGCNLVEEKTLSALPVSEIKYIRVDSIKDGKVVIRFYIYGYMPSFEIRFSENEITSENYSLATIINGTFSQNDKEVTVTLDLSAGLNKGYYVAVKPYAEENEGEIATVRVGGNEQIIIDYHSARVYHGEVLNSFAKLFDEQEAQTPETKLDRFFTDTSDSVLYNMELAPIVDLEYEHYVSDVKLYYSSSGVTVKVRWSREAVDFRAEDSLWDGAVTLSSKSGWNTISINDYTRYIQIVYVDGSAPYEMTAYGYQCGKSDEIASTVHKKPSIGEMMGMCGFTASGGGHTPIDSVSCGTVLREYRNFGWAYTASNYPNKTSFFSTNQGWMGDFDYQYRTFTEAGINVIPCIQWDLKGVTQSYQVDSNNLPKKSGTSFVKGGFYDKMNPHTYFMYADNMFAFAARYGTNTALNIKNTLALHSQDPEAKVGLGYLKWLEIGNEPEGSWNGIHNYYSAYQLAALTSAAIDGHCRTMTSENINQGYHLGAKNGDPNIKTAMAGVSGISNEYITALCYWMKANRPDGNVAIDAFNVHHYMSKPITLGNGATAYVGMSPEEAKIVETLSQLVSIRDKYYPEKEVWITEFGWDTNQSYATVNSSHAYGEYTGRQVQAMWLTRTYLLLSAAGIDKATMYMCEDTGVEESSVGKFGTSGVIAFEYDENGNTVEVKKDSYYYMYTLKNTLGDYTFDCQVESYDENVLIYKYRTDDGKEAYAVWCKTSDGTRHEGYKLGIGADRATMVEAVYGDIDGVQTNLVANDLGYVTVDVSENPIYIVVD